MSDDGIECALRCVESLKKANAPLDATVRQWLHDGLCAFLAGLTDDAGLALGLTRQARADARRELRNFWLRQAWIQISKDVIGRKARAEKLRREIDHFERRVWARVRTRTAADPAWSMLRTSLFYCLKCSPPPPPTTWRQLVSICDR